MMKHIGSFSMHITCWLQVAVVPEGTLIPDGGLAVLLRLPPSVTLYTQSFTQGIFRVRVSYLAPRSSSRPQIPCCVAMQWEPAAYSQRGACTNGGGVQRVPDMSCCRRGIRPSFLPPLHVGTAHNSASPFCCSSAGWEPSPSRRSRRCWHLLTKSCPCPTSPPT